MYLGIDIGGTKTLVACLSDKGVVVESRKFLTPKTYTEFLREVAVTVANLSSNNFRATGAAIPGKVERTRGIAQAFGNLPWKDVPIMRDIQRITRTPVYIENDANLAGLSEAMLLKQHACVVYVTISTGIGTAIITDQQINPEFADSEGGHMLIEHRGSLRTWESVVSGKAIVRRFGKRASEINDRKTWKIITHDIALGLYNLIALIAPDAIVLGGGVLTYFDKFDELINDQLKRFSTPLTPIPPIYQAKHPEEAVVYGCYYLARSKYESIHR